MTFQSLKYKPLYFMFKRMAMWQDSPADNRKFMDFMENIFWWIFSERSKWTLESVSSIQKSPSITTKLTSSSIKTCSNVTCEFTKKKKNPTKKEHFVAFIKNFIKGDAMEIAPPLDPNRECWYLPLFDVYNLKKPDKICTVFDS